MDMNTTEVTYAQLEMHMEDAIELDHPLWVWGASGIGKTAVAEAFAAKNDYDFLDLFLVSRESIDFGGLPHVTDDQRMSFALPTLIPLATDKCEKITIVFLDEFPLARYRWFQLCLFWSGLYAHPGQPQPQPCQLQVQCASQTVQVIS